MKIILLGPPGSGKGTVSECIVKKFKFRHVSAGELLREEVSKGTTIGNDIKRYMEKGGLVPNQFVVEMVKLEVQGKDNYILDGFPRSLSQAEKIEDLKIDAVISLEVSEKQVVERLSGRRLCPKCGMGYHIKFIPPKKAGVCDKCGAKLVQRKDDAPAAVKERFRVYHQETKPLTDYFTRKKMLHSLDASKSPEEVCASAIELVKKIKR